MRSIFFTPPHLCIIAHTAYSTLIFHLPPPQSSSFLWFLSCLILNFAASHLCSLLPIPPSLFLLLPSALYCHLSSAHTTFCPSFFSTFSSSFSATQAIPYLTTFLLPRQLHSTIKYSSHTHTRAHTTSEFTLPSGGSLAARMTKSLYSADLLPGQ